MLAPALVPGVKISLPFVRGLENSLGLLQLGHRVQSLGRGVYVLDAGELGSGDQQNADKDKDCRKPFHGVPYSNAIKTP